MVSDQIRDTVVIVGGSDGASSILRNGLAQQWLAVEAHIDDPSSATMDGIDATVRPLTSSQYGLIGVSAGASAAIQHALQSPERVSALVLVSPLAVGHTGEPNGAHDDLEARLGELQCPTLAVFGQEDASVASGAASVYRRLIPNCNIAFVYGAGHDIAAERPQALLNLVSDYLERRETFIVQNRSGAINP